MANIFDKENAALMSFGKVMSRMAAQPLDISEIWYDKTELETYAASDATAYAGQKVTYVDQENNKVYQYSIQTDGTLKEIGVAPTGDETSITVSAEGLVAMFGFAGAETGSVPVKDAETGALAWKTLEEIGAGDGNDDTTYEFTGLTKTVGEGEDAVEEIYGIIIQPKFNGQNQGDPISIAFDVYTKSEIDARFALKGEDAYDDTALSDKVTALETKVDIGDQKVSEYVAAQIANAQVGKLTKIIADSVTEDGKVVIAGETTDPAEHVIYMVKVEGATGDAYQEYMVIGGELVQTGDTTTDLGDYAKTADVVSNTAFEEFKTANAQAIADARSGAVTDVEGKGYAVATDVANTYAQKTDVYTKDEVYSKSETDTAIADAVKNATGGESASDVLIELNNYKKAVNRELWGAEEVADYTATESRIDTLESADAAQDTLIAANTTLAQKGVDDAAAAQSVADTAKATADQNKTDLSTLQTNFDTIVTKAETGLVAKVAALEQADVDINASIAALQQADVKINETLGSHTTDITNLKISVAAHETAVNTTLPNAIAEKLSTETFNSTIANYYTKTEADGLLGAKADQATTYTKTEVDNLISGLAIGDVNEAIEANADAIAALAGEGNTSTVAKNAADIAALDTTLKAAIENDGEGLDSIKELATWIETHGSEATAMSQAITALETKVDTGDQKVSEYVAAQIAAIPTYTLPAATAEILGGIKSAADVEVDGVATTVANAVYVDATSNVGSVKAVSTDVLVNGANEFILYGGNADASAEA